MTVQRPLYPDIVASHLKGHLTLAAYALNPYDAAHWLCLDADDGYWFRKLIAVSRDLEQNHVPSYLETSRRGGHLWLFTPELSGVVARRFGKQLMEDYQLPKAVPDVPGIELYPKQDRLITGCGSMMRLPLGIHRKSGKRYHFIHPDRTPINPTIREQIATLANPQRISQAFVNTILARAPEITLLKPSPLFARGSIFGENVSDRIKHRLSVYEFVSQYVMLDAYGRGHCPFHDDEHSSFGVNDGRNFWSCFAGCGGGSIIDFWIKMREKRGLDGSFTPTITELVHMLL
jgi:hypothetical protein